MAYKVKSKFIKNLIKGKSFRNERFRGYIGDLVDLERSITGNYGGGWAGGIKLWHLKKDYKKEYKELLKELNPKEHKKFLKEEEKERIKYIEDEKRRRKEESAALEAEKRWWADMGGKV